MFSFSSLTLTLELESHRKPNPKRRTKAIGLSLRSQTSSSSMAAEASRSTTGPADSYIGSLISLTSKSEIRYEGVLFTINTEEASIGLRNVRSFGTEGRRKDGPQVPPIDKVYEYIVFRGSDIKDLQVKSSPPPQTSSMHNDPAIIQSQYGQAPTSTSSPHFSTAAASDVSTQISEGGLPRSPFQSNLPLYQPGGNMSSWGSSATPPTSGNTMIPMYHPGYYGALSNLHSQQTLMFQPPQGFSMPSPAQQPVSLIQKPYMPAVLLQPPGSGGFNVQPSTIPGKSVAVSADTTNLAQVPLLMSQSPGLPLVPPVSNASDMNAVNTITNQIKSFSSHMASYSSTPEPAATSVGLSISPTLVTPGQFVQPGSTSAQFLQLGSAPVQFLQPESGPGQLLQPGSGPGQLVQPGSTPSQFVHPGSGPGQFVQPGSTPSQFVQPGSGPGQFAKPESGPGQFAKPESGTGQLVQPGSGPGQLVQPGSAPGQLAKPGSAPGQFVQPGSQPLQTAHKDPEVVQVSSSVHKKPPAVSASPSASAAAPKSKESQAPLLPLPSPGNSPLPATRPSLATRPSPANREFDKARSHNHHNHWGGRGDRGGRGRGRGRGSELSNSETRFTEDFDFEAMNEKFNKDEVWGHLGKSKANVDDDEEPQYDDNDVEISQFETKPVYNKDDFFDSLSSNSIDNGSRNGRPRFSELRRLDTETFGEFSRYRGGRGGRGPGYGRYNRGGYHGRGGYGYGGRGRGHNNVYRTT